MTDVEALKKRISDSGMTVTSVAEKSGMLRETLYNRLKSGDFKVSEMYALSVILNLSNEDRDSIFLQNKVN